MFVWEALDIRKFSPVYVTEVEIQAAYWFRWERPVHVQHGNVSSNDCSFSYDQNTKEKFDAEPEDCDQKEMYKLLVRVLFFLFVFNWCEELLWPLHEHVKKKLYIHEPKLLKCCELIVSPVELPLLNK